MSIGSRSMKWAYLIHAALSLVVFGVLGWATVASLRLERSEREVARQREHEHKIRLAMYQMENWANPMLFGEFQRGYLDYSPFCFPNAELVRLATGEMLAPGSIIEPSPLFLAPPRQEWILLHFQASPRGGYRSPEVIPEAAWFWPDFEEVFDTWNREPFEVLLARLQHAYTVGDLIEEYEEARRRSHLAALDAAPPLPQEAGQERIDHLATARRSGDVQQSEYTRRKVNAAIVQQVQSPREDCTRQQLAAANIHLPVELIGAPDANEEAAGDDEVGIMYERMLPVWLQIGNRPAPDLAFLRAVYADAETALQGFIIDWPVFRAELLKRASHLFPEARIEAINTGSTPTDEAVFSLIPARLVAGPPALILAVAGWNMTHSFLAIGWFASLVLLAALGLGIRSLVNLSERRSQFAYAVTHELRTPLTTFRLYTDMLAQGMVGEQSRQEYLDTLNNESRRLADLVSGVLEYSRVENKSVPINRESVSVAEVLETVRDTYGPRCGGAGVELRIDAGSAANEILVTDRQHVVRIIGNLVDNACKYGRNDAQPAVSVTAERTDGACRFEVADQGPGVPARLRTRIFKPYQRGERDSSPATGGIGLGLALSRSWAKLLGGHLELVPTPRGARGARFRFTLPLE